MSVRHIMDSLNRPNYSTYAVHEGSPGFILPTQVVVDNTPSTKRHLTIWAVRAIPILWPLRLIVKGLAASLGKLHQKRIEGTKGSRKARTYIGTNTAAKRCRVTTYRGRFIPLITQALQNIASQLVIISLFDVSLAAPERYRIPMHKPYFRKILWRLPILIWKIHLQAKLPYPISQ